MDSIVITIADQRLVTAARKQYAAYIAGTVTDASPLGAEITIEDYLAGTMPLQDWADRWVPDTKEWLAKWSKAELIAAIQAAPDAVAADAAK